MCLTNASSTEDFYQHFMRVCENSPQKNAGMDSLFKGFEQIKQSDNQKREFESLELMMLLKASEQNILARYEFMMKNIEKYSSIITIIEASLVRAGVSAKFKAMAQTDLTHTKSMINFHKEIFDYTVKSQSNQIVLHFAKQKGDQHIVEKLSNQISMFVELIDKAQKEIEKRSVEKQKTLLENLTGLRKPSFFQPKFS